MMTSPYGSDPDAASMPHMRSEFGVDHYAYQSGQRMLVGVTRTIRPHEGETNGQFRQRIHALLAELDGFTSVEMHEEIRAGQIVQMTIHVTYPPTPSTVTLDHRPAGGRPTSQRGRRGGG